jgi:hypothetical protein
MRKHRGMIHWLSTLFHKTSRPGRRPAVRSVRPGLELLEERCVPAVFKNYGGNLLPKVEVQAIYYGAHWNDAPFSSQPAYLDSYLKYLVNSSYMDMLSKAGYGVGRGTSDSGVVVNATVNTSLGPWNDSQTQDALRYAITSNPAVRPPDANRLYVLFLAPGAWVTGPSGAQTSKDVPFAYHSAFTDTDLPAGSPPVHYEVVAFPGPTDSGWDNRAIPGMSVPDSLTGMASHELAEAVTDPEGTSFANGDSSKFGWYFSSGTNQPEGEIADTTGGRFVYLNDPGAGHKYLVQRVSEPQNGIPMSPAGAVPGNPVTFLLDSSGNAWLSPASGSPQWLKSGIASISDQGIDNAGQALVDMVDTAGAGWEYHVNGGNNTWVWFGTGIRSAKAGQGNSWLLSTAGALYRYPDPPSSAPGVHNDPIYVTSGISAIDAGTDQIGVSMVDVIYSNYFASAYEYRLATGGWSYLGWGIRSVSAGQQGVSTFVSSGGSAYLYFESSGTSSLLASNVAAATAGVDAAGNYMIDLLYTNGALYEYRNTSSGILPNYQWSYLWGGVRSISKARAGLVSVIFSFGGAYDHDSYGNWFYLPTSAPAAQVG